MGEPGTKEILSLEELEAAGSFRTGRKHIVSILVENKSGVLTRIAGLFARRGALRSWISSASGDVFCARNLRSAASMNRSFGLEPSAHPLSNLHHNSLMVRIARIIVLVDGPGFSPSCGSHDR